MSKFRRSIVQLSYANDATARLFSGVGEVESAPDSSLLPVAIESGLTDRNAMGKLMKHISDNNPDLDPLGLRLRVIYGQQTLANFPVDAQLLHITMNNGCRLEAKS